MEAIEKYKVGYKKTKLGWIPDEWKVISLGDIGEFKNGINKGKEDFGFGVPFINLMDVFGKPVLKKDNWELVNANKSEIENYSLQRGDVLFIRSSVKPSGVGLTSIVKMDLPNTVYSGFLIRYRVIKKNTLDINYSQHCFYEKGFRRRLMRRSSTSANTNINQDNLKQLLVSLPRLPEQQKIATILSDWDLAIKNVQSLIEKLKCRKKGLMQQLLTGKKRLSGFSEEWQEQKLGVLIIDCKKKTTEQDEYEILTSSNKGLLPQKEYFGKGRISDKKNIGFHVLPPNHITYRSRSDDGKFTFNLNELGYTGIISHYYPVFKMKDGDNKFFVEYANTNKNKFGRYSVGTSQLVLSFNEIKKMKVTFPSPEEQRAISNVLNIAH